MPQLQTKPRFGWLNAKDFGAVGDGVVDDTVALQAVIDAARLTGSIGAKVILPRGIYKTTAPLTVSGSGIVIEGAGAADPSGGFSGTKITNAASNVISLGIGTGGTATTTINIVFRDMTVISTAGGGHTINLVRAGQCSFENCYLVQNNNAKSVVHWPGVEPIIDCLWTGCHLKHTLTATVPGVNATGAGGFFNTNAFYKCRFTNSGEFAVHIEATGDSSYQYDNSFRDINFEIPNAGAVKLKACMNTLLDNCQVYDLSATTTRDMFWIGKNADSLQSQKTTLISCGRRGGTLGASLSDLKLESAGSSETLLMNCGVATSGYTVDFGSRTASVIGEYGTWTMSNGASVRFLDGRTAASMASTSDVSTLDRKLVTTSFAHASGSMLAGLAHAVTPGVYANIRAIPGTTLTSVTTFKLIVWDPTTGAVLAKTADLSGSILANTAITAALDVSLTLTRGQAVMLGIGVVGTTIHYRGVAINLATVTSMLPVLARTGTGFDATTTPALTMGGTYGTIIPYVDLLA